MNELINEWIKTNSNHFQFLLVQVNEKMEVENILSQKHIIFALKKLTYWLEKQNIKKYLVMVQWHRNMCAIEYNWLGAVQFLHMLTESWATDQSQQIDC